jgi:hypothetical protein
MGAGRAVETTATKATKPHLSGVWCRFFVSYARSGEHRRPRIRTRIHEYDHRARRILCFIHLQEHCYDIWIKHRAGIFADIINNLFR